MAGHEREPMLMEIAVPVPAGRVPEALRDELQLRAIEQARPGAQDVVVSGDTVWLGSTWDEQAEPPAAFIRRLVQAYPFLTAEDLQAARMVAQVLVEHLPDPAGWPACPLPWPTQ